MAIACPGCGRCCENMSMWGAGTDVQEFKSVGNQIFIHGFLAELNRKDLKPGMHVYYVAPNEARMRLVGPCKALNAVTRECDAHETTEPTICKKTIYEHAECIITLMASGLV